MADKEEKKPWKTIDNFFDDLYKQHSKDIESSFKAVDEFQKEENINHIQNNILHPAMIEFYNTFKSGLDKQFKGKDDTKLREKGKDGKYSDKKKEVQTAAIGGLKKYFEKTMPSVLKAIEGLKDEGEIYHALVRTYNEYHGLNPQKGEGLDQLIESYIKKKDATVGSLKTLLFNIQSQHAGKAVQYLAAKHSSHHFGKYRSHEVGAYVKDFATKKGAEITDHAAFLDNDTNDYIALRNMIKTGEVPKETHLETQYGLKLYADKKKESK